MGEGAWLVGFLVVQLLAELGLAQRNTARLRAAGGVEFGAAHYPLLVALHSLWLFGLGMLGHDRAIDPFWLAITHSRPTCSRMKTASQSGSIARSWPSIPRPNSQSECSATSRG